MKVVFQLEAVSKEYAGPAGAVAALRNATCEIGPGFNAIIGTSGGGKSTLLNLLGGIDRPTRGVIRFLGKTLPYDNEEAMRWYRANCVSLVFQQLNMISHQRLVENVALPRLLLGESRRSALASAKECLQLLGIGDLAERYPDQVSRGQQQRAAVARAFHAKAAVVLADEPTGSLDPATAQGVMKQFRKLSHKLRRTVVLVTHDVRLVRRYCDRMFECSAGQLRPIGQGALSRAHQVPTPGGVS